MTQDRSEKVRKARMSDAAVKRATGKVWSEWFAILDAADATKMAHPEIARYLSEKHGVGDWWCQMVTVEYERERGLRDVNQKADGYSVNASKTVGLPVDLLYAAWTDERARGAWMGETPLTVRKATVNKSLRVAWGDGRSTVDVHFYAKGDARSQVTVQHNRLSSPDEVEEKRAFWRDALARLTASTEPNA